MGLSLRRRFIDTDIDTDMNTGADIDTHIYTGTDIDTDRLRWTCLCVIWDMTH